MSEQNAARLIAAFGDAITATLRTITGKDFSVTVPPAVPSGAADLKDWQQEIRPMGGVLRLAGSAEFSQTAGRMMLEAAGLDEGTPEEISSAWQEVAGQILGQFASGLNTELGCDVSLGFGSEVPHDAAQPWAELGIQGTGGAWRVLVAWPPELARLFAPGATTSIAAPGTGSGTFEMLLDVALPVAVSFGRTALQIREVLKLNTGSIIELNRLITEPVDIVVNDCVIARGEVVVVDGNYGVRITHIASREERIRTGVGGAEIFPSGVAA